MAKYLGIDSSTQGIKAVLIDPESGQADSGFSVNFGADLPQYGAPEGFIPNPDPLIRHADPRMWLDALELLFTRMRDNGAPMGEIAGISGSGQQHGSVYLNAGFEELLSGLNGDEPLSAQLTPSFSRKSSPIWMDRSTSAECRELDARFGERLRQATGSPAIERFTGPQIRRFFKLDPHAYANTSHIHLVSSFLCSVLTGHSAPVDYGDGAGMNLLNLETLEWDTEITEFTAPGLMDKLPPVHPSASLAGRLHHYFSRYGFKPGIPVTLWSGDNPSSLIGVGADSPGTAVISLGTSDTFFAAMRDYRTDPEGCGHVFGNPAGGFMSLICFTNGSLARERIKRQYGVDWEYFDRGACAESVPGNHGRLMLPYFEAESTPPVLSPGVKRNFHSHLPAENIRALLESQALSMKLHSAWQHEDIKRIRVTGGASGSPAFRQILADVFQADIETIAVGNSAGLGAAIRAANIAGGISMDKLRGMFCGTVETTRANPGNADCYANALVRYAGFEKLR